MYDGGIVGRKCSECQGRLSATFAPITRSRTAKNKIDGVVAKNAAHRTARERLELSLGSTCINICTETFDNKLTGLINDLYVCKSDAKMRRKGCRSCLSN